MKIYSIGFNPNLRKTENRNVELKTSPILTCDNFSRTETISFKGGLTSLAVHCPGCGIKMVTPSRFNVKLNKKALSGKSPKAINVLQEFEKNMHSTEKEVFSALKEQSKNHPNNNLQQLLHRMLPEHLNSLKTRQLQIISKIKPLTADLDKKLAIKVTEIIEEARLSIENGKNGVFFKRKTPVIKINALIEENPKNQTLHRIYHIISSLPSSKNDINSFVIKYSRRSSAEIGQRLVEPSKGTKDHFESLAKEGEDILDNCSNMCQRCNSEKKDLAPNKWMAENPKRFGYIKLYMQDVTKELLNHHSLVDNYIYENYPQNFIDNVLEKLTQNELKRPKPSKKRLKQYKKLHEDLQVIVNDFYAKLDRKREEKILIR